jgi:hypothetical protein
MRIGDLADSHIPMYMAWVRQIRSGDFGFWQPAILSGMDIFSLVYGSLRLDRIFYLLLPGWSVVAAIKVLQSWLAGYFLWRLLRDFFQVDKAVCLLSGLAYALFLPITVGFGYDQGIGLPALPLLFWLWMRHVEINPRKPMLLLFPIGLLMGGTTGPGWVVVAGFGLFTLVVFRQPVWVSFFVNSALFGLGWLVYYGPFVLELIQFSPESNRSLVGVEALNAGVLKTISAVLLGVYNSLTTYVGVVLVIFLARFTLRDLPHSRWGADRAFYLFFVTCLIYILAMAARYTLPGNVDFGGLESFGYWRVFYLLPVFGIIAAATHLTALNRTIVLKVEAASWNYKFKPSVLIAFSFLFVVLAQSVSLKLGNLEQYKTGAAFANIFENPVLESLSEVKDEKYPFRVVSLTWEDISDATPQHPNFAIAYGLEAADGYAPIYSGRYFEFWLKVTAAAKQRVQRYRNFEQGGGRVYLYTDVSAASGEKGCSQLVFNDYANLDLLSLLNVRFIISRCPVTSPDLSFYSSNETEKELFEQRSMSGLGKLKEMLSGNWPGRSIYVYENTKFMPRFFLLNNLVLFDGKTGLLEAMASAPLEYLRRTGMGMISDWGKEISSPDNAGRVDVEIIENDFIRLRVNANTNAVLAISNSYSDTWRVWVNGKEERIRPLYHTLQGVLLSPGRDQEIVLRQR